MRADAVAATPDRLECMLFRQNLESRHHLPETGCWLQLQPLVGNEAPDFVAEAVFDQEFQTISLSQYRVRSGCCSILFVQLCPSSRAWVSQGKYVVLFFYPLDFTFVCPTEITAFSDRHAEFAKLNCEVSCFCSSTTLVWHPCRAQPE